MSQPRILIPIPVQGEGPRPRFSLGENYVKALLACGAVPLLLPVGVGLDEARALFEQADGVMLTGGGDVNPARYHQSPHPTTYGVDDARDELEIALARWAAEADKPLFAICRGIQVVNVALGGSLVQDIPELVPHALRHSGDHSRRSEVLHTVRVETNSLLARLVGAGEVGVNSFHHQAIDRLASGLVITARAPDGIIEGVELPGLRHFLAVQWHPEDMAAERADMQALFCSFVRACVPSR